MKTNIAAKAADLTHGGAVTRTGNPEQVLRRSVMACLLWEDQFYEDGVAIADRIVETAKLVSTDTLKALAVEARTKFNLRHVPLMLLLELVRRGGSGVADTVSDTIGRADEMAELLALYWRGGRKPIPKQMRLGLAKAFGKFDEYQLAKYDGDGVVKLRDVMFMCHPKPADDDRAAIYRRVAQRNLVVPDTWEVQLSGGADKKATFERLIAEGRLGYMALLRNLRGMTDAGVDRKLITRAILARKGAEKVFPFRFLSAAKAAPGFEGALDQAMLDGLAQERKLPGTTVIVVDVSGSMYHTRVSGKSEITRIDAACAIAALAREVCEDPIVYATAGNDMTRIHATGLVPARHGMALIDAIRDMPKTLGGGGIFLKQVMEYIRAQNGNIDRVIVITDEQDCSGHGDSPLSAPIIGRMNYMINVASYKNGIGYGNWTHIDGFSEAVIRYIREYEGI